MHGLSEELLVSLGMAALTVLMHLIGLTALIRLTRLHIMHLRTPWLSLDRLLVPLGLVLGLFGLHGTEVWSYAMLYRFAGAMPHWEPALYLSAGAYSTAGWAGMQAPTGWRIVAALEALNGLLLVGWSTAFLFETLYRILQTEENHPLPEGAVAVEPAEETQS